MLKSRGAVFVPLASALTANSARGRTRRSEKLHQMQAHKDSGDFLGCVRASTILDGEMT